MDKKKKIILIVGGIVLALVLVLAILLPIIINNNIEKEKEEKLASLNKIIRVIESNCEEEKNSEDSITLTAKYVIENKEVYTVLNLENEPASLDFDSEIPDSGVIELDDECKISLSVIYGDYNIIKKMDEEAKIVDHSIYKNGTNIYFNPETNSICEDYEPENSADGVKTGCMKWYAFNDQKKNNTLNLILDHNTTSNTSWVTSNDYKTKDADKEYSNDLGALTVYKKLDSDTSSWQMEARIISIEDIEKIIDTKISLDSTEGYFFDSKLNAPIKSCYKGDLSDCNYGWLYDHTSTNCEEYGCLDNTESATYGYWTSSASTNDSLKAWQVYFDGRVVPVSINQVASGIRPVIEIQKSLLK